MLKRMILSSLILFSLTSKAETYQIIYHVVESGDSLSELSQKFNVSIRDLKIRNSLSDSSIKIGETLLIKKVRIDEKDNQNTISNKHSINVGRTDYSYEPTSGNRKLKTRSDIVINTDKRKEQFINYKVKIGDTLIGIAKRHNIFLNNLLDANNIEKDSILHEKDILLIPSRSKPDRSNTGDNFRNNQIRNSNNYKYNHKQLSDYQIHQVKKGDNLALIAKKYHISEDELIKLNNLKDKDYIKIGQILRFSSIKIQGAYASYKVQQGDTIGTIARKYNISKEKLMLVNELKNEDYIRIGQILKLPSQSAIIYSKPRISDIVNRVLYLPTY